MAAALRRLASVQPRLEFSFGAIPSFVLIGFAVGLENRVLRHPSGPAQFTCPLKPLLATHRLAQPTSSFRRFTRMESSRWLMQ